MNLTRLIYYSTPSESVRRDDLRMILMSARNNNATSEVTGLLCYNLQYFIQALEGDVAAVSRTFCRIAADSRHVDPVIVSCGPIRDRAFGKWRMAYIDDPHILSAAVMKYSESPTLRPDGMAPEALLAFLKHVWRQTQSRPGRAEQETVFV